MAPGTGHLSVILMAILCGAACRSPTTVPEAPINFEVTFQNSTGVTAELVYRGCDCASGQQGQELGRFAFGPGSSRVAVLRQLNEGFDVFIQATAPNPVPGFQPLSWATSCRLSKVGYAAKRSSVVLADGASGAAFSCVGW